MAQKDVEIRIKAKDDASKGVKKISEALKVISTDASAAADAAKKSGGAFGSLAADLAKLKTEGSKLQAFGVITGELDKTAKSLNRAERAARDAAQTFDTLASDQARNTNALSRLQKTMQSEKEAQTAAKAALKAKNDEVKTSTQLVREAEKALEKYNKQLTVRKVGRTNANVFTVPTAEQSVQRGSLEASVRAAKKQQDDAVKGAAHYRAEVEKTTASISNLKPQLAASSKLQTQLGKSTESAAVSLGKARENLASVSIKFDELKTTATGVSASLGDLAVKQDAVAAASAKMAARVAAAQTQLSELKTAKPTTIVRQEAEDPSSRERVARATLEANKAYRSAQEEVRVLAREMKNAKEPTEALGVAFGKAQAKVKLAAAAYREQQAALRGTTSAAQSSFREWSRAVDGKSNTGAATNQRIADSARTATNAQNQLAPAIQRTAAASRSAGAAGGKFSNSLLGISRDTRKSLGLLQRLRGEILSITAGYLGFQSAIRGIKGSLDAFRDLEAAQSRLGAVFAQDTSAVAREVDWLRGQADRLGITFSVLSNQYTKFAVAANQAGFSGENTRKMFLSVAEAGRVNKLSMDQLNGTFMAIEQIISKGKFTSEEVRRQLGDRLPGAFNILAASMGKTTMELDKMMSNGELLSTESNLLKFTGEMTKQFGAQLPESLKTVTTALGRFENNIFKSRLAVADGFIPALTKALNVFDDFANSAEGNQVFVRIGEGVGQLIGLLGEIPKYFDLISTAVKTLITLKVAGWTLSLIQNLNLTRAGFVGLGAQMDFIGPKMQRMTLAQRVLGQGFAQAVAHVDRYRASIARAAIATGGMTASSRATFAALGLLRGAMMSTANVARAMWTAIGGLPGLLVTGIVFAIGKWAMGVDEASTALSEHRRQVQAVTEAYEVAGGAANKMALKVKGVTITIAQANLDALTAEYDKATNKIVRGFANVEAMIKQMENTANSVSSMADMMPASMPGEIRYLGELIALFREGELGVADFAVALDDLNRSSTNEKIKEITSELSVLISSSTDGADSLLDLEDALNKQRKILDLLEGKITSLGEEVTETNKAFDKTESVDAYTASINSLKEAIPSLAAEMKKLKDITDLNKTAWDGLVAAWNAGDYGKMMEIVGLWGQAQHELNNQAFGGSSGSGVAGGMSTIDLIKKREGLILEAEWDKNHMRVGYGSDTYVDKNGVTQVTVKGTVITADQANKDLANRIVQFQNTIRREIGSDRFEAFSESQKAALTSIAYNYGNLSRTGALNTFKTGSNDEIVAAIRGLGNHNDGENRGRRNEEADIFASGGTTYQTAQLAYEANAKAQAEASEQAAKDAEKRREEAQKQAEATQKRIGDTEFEISQQGLLNAEKGRQAAIETAIRDAKAENPNITEAELEKVRELTGALYDQQNVVDERVALEERVNQLYELRQNLLEQQRMLEEQGNTSGAAEIKTQLEGVNEQLREAIDNATAYWQAMGGPEADAAIAKLATQRMSLEATNNKIVMLGLNAQQFSTLVGSFADGLVNAFDSFVQKALETGDAIRAAKEAFLQFAADFLRQIALMILKQIILNALSGIGGPIGIAAKGLGGIAGHTGGLVGSAAIGGGNRIGSGPTWVNHAFRYHTGGIVGLRPDEVSATLKRNEEVLTEEDPRHRFNQGGEMDSTKGGMGIRQVLAVGDDEIANAMSGSAGERVIMTVIQRNRTTIRKELD